MDKLINISQLSKLLNLVNLKTNKPSNHILRFWESEFKQIKPIVIKNRRYYSSKQVDIIKIIYFLLKDKGMTIKGVKKILQSKINVLDDHDSYSLKAAYHKDMIKQKSRNILKRIKSIKKYGKKNSS